LLTLGLRGNLVADAWIASTVETLGEHLVAFDYDFERLLPARDFTTVLVRLIQTNYPKVFLTLPDFIFSAENLMHDRINIFRTVYGDFLLLV